MKKIATILRQSLISFFRQAYPPQCLSEKHKHQPIRLSVI
ncbi:hypothetical protein HMPREF9370_2481 [Neisseria wadsworthii 9715]|uniref:Uncharacterized protein n=1 Tax=Neisseria wadsworthii 9715 TaxID=1030841 RepID=G4CTS1_9NEIS|nr:hypothetical protein HMPREF9370_2481 [Neisseria wadsworthii 9715]